MNTDLEKRAIKFLEETDTMQFETYELLTMFNEQEEKSAITAVVQAKPEKFACYEIHTVQARMYGCDKQCSECKLEQSKL